MVAKEADEALLREVGRHTDASRRDSLQSTEHSTGRCALYTTGHYKARQGDGLPTMRVAWPCLVVVSIVMGHSGEDFNASSHDPQDKDVRPE